MTIDEIDRSIVAGGASHVVITGGEPMLPVEIEALTRRIRERGLHITIETAGTIDRDVECDLISISPKMSNSTPTQGRAGDRWVERHERTRNSLAVVQSLIQRYDYQLKFVVVDEKDIEELTKYCRSLDGLDNGKVLLMPEGIDEQEISSREAWMKPICDELGFVFCQRMHILWYGNRRGT